MNPLPNSPYDLLITNGLLVAEGKITRADIAICGEKIVDVLTDASVVRPPSVL